MIGYLLILAVIVGLFLLLKYVADLHSKNYFLQYAFFTRYSTAHALLLFFLPLAGSWIAPTMLANLFVMGFWGAVLTSLSATLYAWAIVYTFRLTRLSIPIRCRLPYKRKGVGWLKEAKKIAEDLKDADYKIVPPKLALYSLVIVAPLFLFVTLGAEEAIWINSLGLAVGLVLATLVFKLGSLLNDARETLPAEAWTPQNRTRVDYSKLHWFTKMRAVYLDYYTSFEISPAMSLVHRRASRFFQVSLLIVFVLGVVYSPWFKFNTRLPALVILLSLLMLITWISGVIGFVFDKDRVPVLLVLVLFGVLLQFLLPNDHLYRTEDWPQTVTATASQALESRIARIRKATAPDQPVIAIASSGGGIRASHWTAVVLENLAEEIDDFNDRVSVISSVSGGSIASAYYFDQHICNDNEKGTTERSAATSSLAATVWGLTYLESPRLILGAKIFSWLNGKFVYYDRGWVQEKTWSKQLNKPELKLSDLAENVSNGQWPIPIFNSCFQESGQRFLISPVDIQPPKVDKEPGVNNTEFTRSTSSFFDTVSDLNQDMRLVTAARLSASFPYATPQSRSQEPTQLSDQSIDPLTMHGADGGFYDNSGILTVLEIFDRFLQDKASKQLAPDPEILKIALIEIRASPGDFEDSISVNSGGLANELVGPPNTIYNVLFGSQSARNRQEINWLTQLWQERENAKAELRHFVFYLSGGPLSWHLTEHEKQQIRWHWSTVPISSKEAKRQAKIMKAREHNAATLAELKKFTGCKN